MFSRPSEIRPATAVTAETYERYKVFCAENRVRCINSHPVNPETVNQEPETVRRLIHGPGHKHKKK